MIKKLSLVLVAFVAVVGFAGLLTQPAYATAKENCVNTTKFFGLPSWYEYLPVVFEPSADDPTGKEGNCRIDTDATGGKTVILVLLAIVDILFRLGAIVAVVFVVYGGFMFVVSQGDPAKTVSARKTILNAVIGLVIVILASQLVKFIATFLSKP